MGDKFVEKKNLQDNVAMSPKDEYGGDYCVDKVHNLIINGALANDDEENDGHDKNDDYNTSSCTRKLQDLKIERNVYWQSQQTLLQEILDYHASIGIKMKQEIIWVIEMARETSDCVCLSPKSSVCCKCLRQKVVNALCSKGFFASLSTSKWRHTSKLQGGTHEYIEVVVYTKSKKKQSRLLIELYFRDEFKMAIACDEYHNLINRIPETYIGEYELLNAIVRLLCDAAKRSAWEKRIHIGPWRKRSFMLKKWSASGLLDQPFTSGSNALELVLEPSKEEVNMPIIYRHTQFSSSVGAVEVI